MECKWFIILSYTNYKKHFIIYQTNYEKKELLKNMEKLQKIFEIL